MASPRVISSANADLASQSPLYSVGHLAEPRGGDQTKSSLGSINMEELLRNFYADNPAAATAAEISSYPDAPGGANDGEVSADVGEGEPPLSRQVSYGGEGRKTAEEVWREISGDHGVVTAAEPVYKEAGFGEVTLEAFLARAVAVAVADEDVSPGAVLQQQEVDRPMLGFVVDPSLGDRPVQQQRQQPELLQVEGSHARFGNGVEGGRKRVVLDPMDKAAQQKQRRMIKNRESAARSRERKQAYTAELEKLVTKLAEENARLVRHQEEQNKARLKQLMENLVPVGEGRRPPRRLRRTCSTHW